jgi:hypothetical protein
LERQGYEVNELSPELDEKIFAAIRSAIKPPAAKERLMQSIADMTYPEKTFIIQTLEKHGKI